MNFIKELQRALKYNVFNIKVDIKRLFSNLKTLKDKAYINAGKSEYIEEFNSNLTELVDKIHHFQEYLITTDNTFPGN